VVQHDDRTFGERIADDVAEFAGSWKFIILFGCILLAWIIFISLEFLKPYHFDPYPFILLNLVLSFVAAFQAPFIMMSQNRTEKKQDTAYREIFTELKELVEQDIAHEEEIKGLEKQIQTDLERLIATQNKLLDALHHAVTLGQLTSEGVAEVLEHLEDEEKELEDIHGHLQNQEPPPTSP
jgi:uncharacterized membrane protein